MTFGHSDTAGWGSALDDLTRLVRDHSGLEIPVSRRETLARLVERSVAAASLNGPAELVRRLSEPANGAELVDFVAALTIGETHFFRNSPQFDVLRSEVIPGLIAARQDTTRRLRIWSAACSSGEEAYSLAMLVDQLLPNRDNWQIEIVGTDINPQALARARAGVYGLWSFRQAPEDMVRTYFTAEGKEYLLRPHIREMVSFSYLNLTACQATGVPPQFRQMDLILCRNVFIYFPADVVDRVARRLAEALAPDGWFVTGHAESPMPAFRACFAARDFPLAVLYQAPEAGLQEMSSQGERPRPVADTPATQPESTSIGSGHPDGPDRSERSAKSVPDGHDGSTVPQPSGRELCARAEVSWRAGATDAALADCRRAAELDSLDARPVYLAARILAGLRQLDAALHTVALAIEREPSTAQSHYLHGMILQELGRDAAALESFRRTVYLDADYVLGHLALANIHSAAGATERSERALATVSELLDMRSDDDVIDDDLTVADVRALVELNRSLVPAAQPPG